MIYAVRSNGASDPNHEPPIFQGSVLGRDHRIAVGGSRQEERGWRSACSRPGAGKTSNTGQSASKRGLTRGGKPSAPDHESRKLEPGKPPPTPWSALLYTVTKNMLLLPDMTVAALGHDINLPPNCDRTVSRFLTCRFDRTLKPSPRLCHPQTRTDSRL